MTKNILRNTGEGLPSEIVSEKEAPFIRLASVSTSAATPVEIQIENIKSNLKRGLPRLHDLSEFKQVKGKDNPIVLVGGGPSLLDEKVFGELLELSKNNPIIACGSSHDFLVKKGIVPTYCTVCDPDEIMGEYLTKLNKFTMYLIASGCHPSVLDKLKDYEVYLWHCYSDGNEAALKELEPDFQAVGGGCTVGLRSISIAIMLGYSNLHFFGFDSCIIPNESHHAYDFVDYSKEQLGTIYKVKLGTDTPLEEKFYCAGYHIAQAEHFKEYYSTFGYLFEPTFHGPGLLTKMMELVKEETKKMNAEADKSKQENVLT